MTVQVRALHIAEWAQIVEGKREEAEADCQASACGCSEAVPEKVSGLSGQPACALRCCDFRLVVPL